MAFVYLIGDREKDGYYKIGVTRGNVNKRLKTLQTGNGGELFLVNYHETKYPFVIENMLHNRFQSRQMLNEWYELEMSDIHNFSETCESLENIIFSMKENPFFKKKYLNG